MNPELKKAFGGIEPDLYGEAELLEQLQYNIDHGLVPDPNNSASHHSHNPNYNSTEPDTTPDILGDLAKQASKELVGMSWTEAEVCHERTVELFNTILPNLDIPTLSDFEQAGIDFDKLQTGYEAYERAGLEPQLVFAPINLISVQPTIHDKFSINQQFSQSIINIIRINHLCISQNGFFFINCI